MDDIDQVINTAAVRGKILWYPHELGGTKWIHIELGMRLMSKFYRVEVVTQLRIERVMLASCHAGNKDNNTDQNRDNHRQHKQDGVTG